MQIKKNRSFPLRLFTCQHNILVKSFSISQSKFQCQKNVFGVFWRPHPAIYGHRSPAEDFAVSIRNAFGG